MRATLFASAGILMVLSSAPASARASDADRAFLTQDVQGGRYELALARLGAAKATRPAIRAYSQMVVRDHTQANAALTRLARSEGISAPAGMKADDAQRLAKLRAMKGAAFDQAYVDEQNRINAEDKQDADKEKASTKEPAIRAYLARFAAMDAKHQSGAEALKRG